MIDVKVQVLSYLNFDVKRFEMYYEFTGCPYRSSLTSGINENTEYFWLRIIFGGYAPAD